MAHIRLNTHPSQGGVQAPPVVWGARDPAIRGPVVGTVADPAKRNAIGVHSGSYGIYRALAIAAHELKADHRPDFTDTSPAELIGPFESWFDPKKIVSLDPWGHLVASVFADKLKAGWDIRPTIAVTKAHISMPEIKDAIDAGRLKPDGSILKANGEVRVTKAAVEPVWWLPGIAERFGVPEVDLRRTLFEQTGGMYTELVTRPDLELFLPPIGGATIYFFGDMQKIGKPETKIACRLHDECNGSDVFSSDICTCRPYLAHGIEVCIEMAQQDGLGVVIYNRKEGRALGEVTKFLVYNARKRQVGGDFGGAIFQPHRMRRGGAGHALPGADARSLPLARHRAHRPLRVDEQPEVRRAARAGHRDSGAGGDPRRADPGRRPGRDGCQESRRLFHDDEARDDRSREAQRPRAQRVTDTVAYLRTPAAIRERAGLVMRHVENGQSPWFSLDPAGLEAAVQTTLAVTRKRFRDPSKIPFHSRWRHFEAGGRDRWAALAERLRGLPPEEVARRRIDLAVVSVLLDAGAGGLWSYREPATGQSYMRSEGLAVASFNMFAAGAFSRDSRNDPLRVDAERLARLTPNDIAMGFQVRGHNSLLGLEGRAGLLRKLGGVGLERPGALFDLLATGPEVKAESILAVLLDRLSAIWPSRLELDGMPLGDVWQHPAAGYVPFHKLSQWLSYSIVEPLQGAGLRVVELDALTGLPEYRNGGLLVDAGALRPKQKVLLEKTFAAGDEPIVEWRALTVALLDRIAEHVRLHLKMDASSLPLVKVLEAGTWFAGRVLAAERRKDGGPPISVASDGTVF